MSEIASAPSVLDAIDSALAHTKRICFSPFDLNKWFTLGFCAFLSAIGQGGGYTGGNPFGGAGRGDVTERWVPWVLSHLVLVLGIFAVVLVLGTALWALFLWLGSRGEFMFLEGVLKNRGAVSEPWNRFREAGNSLFGLRFVIGLIGMAVVLTVMAVALAVAWPAIRSEVFNGRAVAAVLFGTCVLFPVAIFLILIQLVLRDFVVPIMYKRGIHAAAALQAFRDEVLRGRLVSFLLFYGMLFVLSLAAGVLVLVGMCLTCCVAALPYLSSVAFLPVFVFFRCYALCFLQQVSPEWTLLPPPGGEPAAVAPPGAPPAGPAPALEQPQIDPGSGGARAAEAAPGATPAQEPPPPPVEPG
jgi:hypothetical protein